jgi:hypothetical protein
MTNGLVGLAVALGTLLAPVSALPPALRAVAMILPTSHVMTWVRGGSVVHLVLACVLSLIAAAVVVLAVSYLEESVRRRALSLEA